MVPIRSAILRFLHSFFRSSMTSFVANGTLRSSICLQDWQRLDISQGHPCLDHCSSNRTGTTPKCPSEPTSIDVKSVPSYSDCCKSDDRWFPVRVPSKSVRLPKLQFGAPNKYLSSVQCPKSRPVIHYTDWLPGIIHWLWYWCKFIIPNNPQSLTYMDLY